MFMFEVPKSGQTMVSLTILLWSHFTGFITCDDECTSVFADGCPLVLDNATYNNWRVATKIIIPSGTKVVAIHAKDHGGPEGILGSFSNGQVTDATWKCHSSPVPSEWASADFNDSSWPAAVEHRDHGSAPWNIKTQNISDDAKWIWTKDNLVDNEVYCRVRLLGAQWSSLPSQSVQSTKTCPHSNSHMTPSTTSVVHSGNVKMEFSRNLTQNVKKPGFIIKTTNLYHHITRKEVVCWVLSFTLTFFYHSLRQVLSIMQRFHGDVGQFFFFLYSCLMIDM